MQPSSVSKSCNKATVPSGIIGIIFQKKTSLDARFNVEDVDILLQTLHFGMLADHIPPVADLSLNPLKEVFLHTP